MRSNILSGVLKFAASVFVLSTFHILASAQAYTSMEQACYDNIQGKIAWDQQGHKQWAEGNLRALCKGARMAAPRGQCFQNRMPSLGWEAAIEQCGRLGQPNGAPQAPPPESVPAPSPANPSAPAQGYTPMEQACYDNIQGKIAWDQQGHMQWAEGNLRALCKGARMAAPRGQCFQNRMPSLGWEAAVEQCSKLGQPNAPSAPPGNPLAEPPVPRPAPPSNIIADSPVTPLAPATAGTPPIKTYAFGDWGYTANEQACNNLLQEKVKWRNASDPRNPLLSQGNIAWSEEAMNALCNGTTNPQATVSCWTSNIALNNYDDQKTLRQCATIPPPAGRTVNFTVYASLGPGTASLTPDQSDPAQITIYKSPLSDADLQSVLTWIANRVAALKTPYCYRQTYARGAGQTLGCAAGLEQGGLLCYPPTQSGYYCNGPACYGNCPAGFTDNGAVCLKPAPYGRGSGYAIWNETKCNNENPSVGCEQNGAYYYPKCQPNFHAVGCCICSPDCPSGMTDTGVDCAKTSYGRGAGTPLDTCPAGLERGGLLCYQPTRSGYYCNGPTCSQQCPSAQPTDCGAGCATSKSECASDTASMIVAPILAAIQIATFAPDEQVLNDLNEVRLAANARSAGTDAEETALQLFKLKYGLAEDQGFLQRGFNSVKKALASVKNTGEGIQESVESFVGGPDALNAITNTAARGWSTKSIVQGGYRLVNTYATAYSTVFPAMTSPEIDQAINANLGPTAATYVKMAWARHNLALILQANGSGTAQDILPIISAYDPTGIAGVVSAFNHPICYDGTPFPSVTPLYTF